MAPAGPGRRHGEVAVEVEEDRSRDMTRVIRSPPSPGLAERPAHVDDAQSGLTGRASRVSAETIGEASAVTGRVCQRADRRALRAILCRGVAPASGPATRPPSAVPRSGVAQW